MPVNTKIGVEGPSHWTGNECQLTGYILLKNMCTKRVNKKEHNREDSNYTVHKINWKHTQEDGRTHDENGSVSWETEQKMSTAIYKICLTPRMQYNN